MSETMTEKQTKVLTNLGASKVTAIEDAGDKRTLNALHRREFIALRETKKGTTVRITAKGKKALS